MLVVWEPILPTDWEPPTTAALARIHGPRVAQFWDKHHLVAKAIGEELNSDPNGPKPSCCMARGLFLFGKGSLWDLAVIFPKQAVWHGRAPQALFANGPVADVQPRLRRKLGALLGHAN